MSTFTDEDYCINNMFNNNILESIVNMCKEGKALEKKFNILNKKYKQLEASKEKTEIENKLNILDSCINKLGSEFDMYIPQIKLQLKYKLESYMKKNISNIRECTICKSIFGIPCEIIAWDCTRYEGPNKHMVIYCLDCARKEFNLDGDTMTSYIPCCPKANCNKSITNKIQINRFGKYNSYDIYKVNLFMLELYDKVIKDFYFNVVPKDLRVITICKLVECTKCKASFKNITDLWKHKRSEGNEIPCPESYRKCTGYCRKLFQNKFLNKEGQCNKCRNEWSDFTFRGRTICIQNFI
jgi:hypothetical protein